MSVLTRSEIIFSIIAAVCMYVTGVLATIVAKMSYDEEARGTYGYLHPWQKPLFITELMFLGELCVIFGVIALIVKIIVAYAWEKRQMDVESVSLLIDDSGLNTAPSHLTSIASRIRVEAFNYKVVPFIFILPASCDVFGTGLSNVGLVLTYASVYQMLRGTIIVFTTIFTRIFVKNSNIGWDKWLGVLLTMVGAAIVGYASYLQSSSTGSAKDIRLVMIGNLFVLVAMIVNAAQYTLQEIMMKKLIITPWQEVSMEGVWGVMMGAIILPILYFIPGTDHGSVENDADGIVMMFQNPKIIGLTATYVISIAIFNASGLYVTVRLNAVHRTFLDAMRVIGVWLVQLALRYSLGPNYGEEFTRFSIIQLVGFCVMLFGSAIYNGLLSVIFPTGDDIDGGEKEFDDVKEEVLFVDDEDDDEEGEGESTNVM